MNDENYIYGLAYECPHEDRETNCPFRISDNLSFKEKVKWLGKRSAKNRKKLVQHHCECTEVRAKDNRKVTTYLLNNFSKKILK